MNESNDVTDLDHARIALAEARSRCDELREQLRQVHEIAAGAPGESAVAAVRRARERRERIERERDSIQATVSELRDVVRAQEAEREAMRAEIEAGQRWESRVFNEPLILIERNDAGVWITQANCDVSEQRLREVARLVAPAPKHGQRWVRPDGASVRLRAVPGWIGAFVPTFGTPVAQGDVVTVAKWLLQYGYELAEGDRSDGPKRDNAENEEARMGEVKAENGHVNRDEVQRLLDEAREAGRAEMRAEAERLSAEVLQLRQRCAWSEASERGLAEYGAMLAEKLAQAGAERDAAYRRGQGEMREWASTWCDSEASRMRSRGDHSQASTLWHAYHSIRAIPIANAPAASASGEPGEVDPGRGGTETAGAVDSVARESGAARRPEVGDMVLLRVNKGVHPCVVIHVWNDGLVNLRDLFDLDEVESAEQGNGVGRWRFRT